MGWTLVNWGFAERFGAGHMGAGSPADPSCQEKDHLSMTDALKLGFSSFATPTRGVLVVFCDDSLNFGAATKTALGSAADAITRAA